MVSCRMVVIVTLDSGRRIWTEIRFVKTLTIMLLVRLFEQWRRDASENPVRTVSVERLLLNVFVGESGDRLAITHFPAFPRHDHHICFDSDSWKDC